MALEKAWKTLGIFSSYSVATLHCFRIDELFDFDLWYPMPGSAVIKIGLLHFLSGCRRRQLLYYYCYRKKRFRWHNVKRLQGHLTNAKNSDEARV